MTDPLTSSIDVVGTPRARLKVDSPTAQFTQFASPGGQLVLNAVTIASGDSQTLTLPVVNP